LLGSASPQAAGEVVAHEALEAWAAAGPGLRSYDMSHTFANLYFGNVTNGPEQFLFSSSDSALYYTQSWTFKGLNSTFEIK
jgi:hypothetical protein